MNQCGGSCGGQDGDRDGDCDGCQESGGGQSHRPSNEAVDNLGGKLQKKMSD